MPDAPKSDALPPRRSIPWPAFLLLALSYLYAFPYFGALRSANEVPRILTTQALVDHGRFWIDDRLSELGSRNDLSSPPNGHKYANKPPGPSFLAAPAYLVCKGWGTTSLRACTWAFRVTAVTLPALAFLFFLPGWLRRFTTDEDSVRAVFLAYALASPAFVYGLLFMSHQPSAVCAGGAFGVALSLARGPAARPLGRGLLLGFLAATAVMMDYQAFIASAVVGLYFLSRCWRNGRAVAGALLGAIPPTAALLYYHAVAFGSPFKTGYNFSDDPNPTRGVGGMVALSWHSLWNITLLPANGLLVLAPWTVLAVVGGVAVAVDGERRRRMGREALACGVIVVGYLLFMSALNDYMSRGGWCVGPRYLTTALPFLACLAVVGYEACRRHVVSRVLAQASILVGAVIFVVAGATYPHWPDPLANPLYEVSFRLLREGYAVHSLGTLVGLRGLWATLPLFLGVAVLLAWGVLARRRHGLWSGVLASLLALAIVWSYQFFPGSGAYAKRAYGFITATWEPPRK
jgi:hypothetical protein